MAAEHIDDFADARAAFDRRTRVVLGRGRPVPRAAVRRAVRPRCSTRRPASSGRRGSSAAACNAATMCLDRAATPTRPAVVWEGEDGATPHADAAPSCGRSTDRIAAGLAARGVGEGDAVGLFMPMVPETVAALFAIAKLGAIFLPIFSGYGADAVAIRLADARGGRGRHRRRLHAPRQARRDEGDGRRGGRAGAECAHGRGRRRRGRDDAPMHDGRDIAARRSARRRPFAARSGRQRAPAVRRVHERHDRAARRARCTCTAGSR